MLFTFKRKDKYQWHKWFVWYPIWFTNNHGEDVIIWLRNVERRYAMTYDGVGIEINYE
jgi:hypothetical protein